MTELLKAMNGHPERHLYMDIKHVDLAALAREVREAHVEHQVLVAS